MLPWWVLNNGRDGNVDGSVADQTGGEARVAGHGAVHGVLREERAEDGIGGVCRDRADHVRWVDVLDGHLLKGEAKNT